jgi:hypothetical protein
MCDEGRCAVSAPILSKDRNHRNHPHHKRPRRGEGSGGVVGNFRCVMRVAVLFPFLY